MFDDGIKLCACTIGGGVERLFNFFCENFDPKVGVVYSVGHICSELPCHAILKWFCADEVALCNFAKFLEQHTDLYMSICQWW